MTTNWRSCPSNRLIIDNGSNSIRIGITNNKESQIQAKNVMVNVKRSTENLFCEDVERIMNESYYRY